HPRLLPLEGGRNFRDLGGYPAADGRTVRWGKLYRSGAMTNLTDADYRHLTGLGLRVVSDFRSNEERDDEPARWEAVQGVDYRAWDYSREDETDGRVSLTSLLVQPDMTPEKVRAIVIRNYSDIVEQHKEKFADLFQRLALGEVPLVFNCSAGKDRTGVAAALVLVALEVPVDCIVEDYALSERLVDFEAELLNSNPRPDRDDELFEWVANAPIEQVRPLLRSEPAYLQAAFRHMNETYGGAMSYIRKELGVDDRSLSGIRGLLLE
ncbi:MAG: tyrosine-protein phosphatase, partial [Gammaproteobacteria bacterium]|nr:tyrosine-protein phosphatase [Gammaproteobacteria bacterium]